MVPVKGGTKELEKHQNEDLRSTHQIGYDGVLMMSSRYLALGTSLFLIWLGCGVGVRVLAQTITPDPLEDIVNIDLRTDIRLFAVTAAVNVAGFDDKLPGEEMSTVRSLVRSSLANLDEALVRRLQVHYKLHQVGDEQATQTAYTSLALLLDGPPDFKIPDDAPHIPPDVQEILGFEELLPDFYHQADLQSLWRQCRPLYVEELESYRPVIKSVIRDTLDYFRIPARVVLDRKIVLIADLLTVKGIVNARNLERIYYIVVGPTEDPAANFPQLQHEYLHFLVDPLVEKHGGQLMKERELLTLADDQPNIGRDFRGRFLLIVGESLIEALLHRFHPVPNPEAELVRLFRRGLIFVPYFMEVLERYESTPEVTFPAFAEDLFKSIEKKRIEADGAAVARWEEMMAAEREAQAAARLEAQQAQARRQEINDLLAKAGELISKEAYAEAEGTLNQLLEKDPHNGNAFFYLAQLSAQQQDHERAVEYYKKAEVSENVQSWVRAWSSVRVGRYLAYQRKFAEARQRFEQVLKSDGDLKGAREAAQESLSSLPAETES